MQAIPDDEEMEKCLRPPVVVESRTIETQTSVIERPEENSDNDRSKDLRINISTQKSVNEELLFTDDSQNEHRTVKERTLLFFNNIGKKRQVEHAKMSLNETT